MNSKIVKKLQKENEKLREALTNSLMPLHLAAHHYGSKSLRHEAIDLAKKALKEVKSALEYDASDMAFFTESDEEDWEEWDMDVVDAWLGTKDDDEDS
jgi:fumarate hydratase class II